MFNVSGKKIYRDRKITIKLFRVPNPLVSGSGLGLNCAYTMAIWLCDHLEAPILKWHQRLDENRIHGHWTRTHDHCQLCKSSGTEAGRQDHLPEGEGKDVGNRQPKQEALLLCCQGIIHCKCNSSGAGIKVVLPRAQMCKMWLYSPSPLMKGSQCTRRCCQCP